MASGYFKHFGKLLLANVEPAALPTFLLCCRLAHQGTSILYKDRASCLLAENYGRGLVVRIPVAGNEGAERA